MKKNEILIVFFMGIIPLFWFLPGFIIAKGDHYPYILNVKSLDKDFYTWSSNNLGNPSPLPAYILYDLLWVFLQFANINIGLLQIILLMIYFVGATFSIFYLTKTVYHKENFAAMITSIFYIFNFFVMLNLWNIGMMWTYAFLPLLIALFIKSITNTQVHYRYIIGFALAFTIVASISSINFADVALIIISLGSVFFYYSALERKVATRRLIKNVAMLLVITSLLSTWWIVPTLNYYLSPSTELQQGVNVQSWSWTHDRASFLNLLLLNGGWGWRPEYFPYYNFYSDNPILLLLLFMPFLLASTALLFKDSKSKLNAYFMLIILLFTFLAKGLHEPLSFVNLFLYVHIPFMNMFREPVSKFTLVMIPFLALLVGHATNKIAETLIHHKLARARKLFIIGVIAIFTISTFPILTNPIETKTEQIPYSSYVKIPQYWYEASEWLSNNTGDFKILVTPFNDYYQVPYVWGYYGTDSFLERLIQKPIIGRHYVYYYKVNQNIVVLMDQLYDAFKYNRTKEFETIISLFNVKYIVQRNDLDYEYITLNERDIATPERMRNFLSNQPNVTLAKTIGKLDIYEYTRAQPYFHILKSKEPQEYDVEIMDRRILNLEWSFNSTNQLNEWKNTTLESQFGATCKLSIDDASLKFELWNSTWGWKALGSPLMTARYEAKYSITLDIKGENAHEVHIKIFEYDQKMKLTYGKYVSPVTSGTFSWTNFQIDYIPKIENTTFLQIQIWNGHETSKPLPNILWIDNIEIQGSIKELDRTNIQQAFGTTINNLVAEIIEYQKSNPTQISVKVNASQPFVLAINEAYDPNWRAHLNGKTIPPVPILSVMNGFLINQTGELRIVVEYEPQKWFHYGSIISVTTFLACLVYLITRWNKLKRALPFSLH